MLDVVVMFQYTENDEKKTYKNVSPGNIIYWFFVGNCGSGGAVWGGGLKMCLLGVYHIQGVWFYMMVWYVYRATFEPYTGVSLMKQTFIFYGIFFPEKKNRKKHSHFVLLPVLQILRDEKVDEIFNDHDKYFINDISKEQNFQLVSPPLTHKVHLYYCLG